MLNTDTYQPVPHDAAFRKSILAQPGVQDAYDALEEDYTALHTLLAARRDVGLTQLQIAQRMGTTVSVVSRLEGSLRSEKHSPSYATLRKYANACGRRLVVQMV
jgi:ribosome-binding protein aMBF1 (putative translation factor)